MEKILVINDDESIRDLTKMILENKGYVVAEAIHGKEGISQALTFKPDLILLDIMMPEMDGYEACEKLKADPSTHDIPILFFSSLTSPKDKIRGLELGAVDFINNIVDQGELLARVQTHLHIQALTHQLKRSNEELMRKQKALDEDLDAAATIQRSFLPPSTLQIHGIQIASFWNPIHPVGGDIFNVIQKDHTHTLLYMVDVSGHDVPSALVSVSVSQYLQQQAHLEALLSPKEIMVTLDQEYPLERFNKYFTIFYLIITPSTGELRYSCAAHPPAIIVKKNGGLKLLDKGGTIIGMNAALPFEEGEDILEIGDKIFIYTDGIVEMKNSEGKTFGTELFYELLENLREEPIVKIVEIIKERLKSFTDRAQDDLSLIGLERIASK